MTPATEQSYRKLAAYFYERRLGGQVTPKRISDGMKDAAQDYRPAYWRRLRSAIAFDQAEKGHQAAAERVRATRNPVTVPTSGFTPKAKQRRVRAVSAGDERALLEHFQSTGDRQSYGAVMLAKITGARPAEMPSITVDGNRVTIQGAKKSHDGKRGADRVMLVSEGEAQMVTACVQHLKSANVGAVQDRLRAAGRKLWPQRAALPSLYSWRHQLGAELKASGIDRKEVAYLMGHQSTASVDRYGNRRSARGGKVPRAPEKAFESVREMHREPPTNTSDFAVLEREIGEVLQERKADNVRLSNDKTEKRQAFSHDFDLKPF